MNSIVGKIEQIQRAQGILLADISAGALTFSALLVDAPTDARWLSPENWVRVLFKETEVSLAKDLQGLISMRNQITGIVTGLQCGELLARVSIRAGECEITSVITTRSANKLAIQLGDTLTALIKANEISLQKID